MSTNNWTQAEEALLEVWSVGVAYINMAKYLIQTTFNGHVVRLSGTTTKPMMKDSYIDIRVYQNSGNDLNLGTVKSIQIEEVSE